MLPKNPSEHQEQAAVIQWMKLQHPWLVNHTIYIMNEKRCSAYVGSQLNKQGRLPGASDLFIANPNFKYHGLFIEMKSLTGKPTKIQLEFLERMSKFGYFACCCCGADNAIATITAYLNNKL
jgi:hypothetical protein